MGLVRRCQCGCNQLLPDEAHGNTRYLNAKHRDRHKRGTSPRSAPTKAVRGRAYEEFCADGWPELIEDGMTYEEVTTLTGINKGTISRLMKAWHQDRDLADAPAPEIDTELFSDLTRFTEVFFPEDQLPDFHKEWVEAIDQTVSTGKKLLLLAPQRFGKAIDAETPMLTRDQGWIPASAVRVGDFLVGSDGGWTRVEGVFPQGVTEAWEVTFGDGSSLVTCGQHRWAVQTRYAAAGQKRSRQDSWQVKTTDELRESLGTGSLRRIPMIAPLKGRDEDLPFDPYLLGCWLGDGSTTAAAITSADPEIVQAFVDAGFTPTRRVTKGRAETVHFVGSAFGQGLQRVLRDLDVFGNKHVPEEYLHSTAENRLALLQGLMDTDGTVGGSTGQVSFSSTNPSLVQAVKWIVTSLGGTWTEYAKTPWYYDAQRERVYGKPAWTVGILLPDGMPPFRLRRKLEKVPEHQASRAPRRIIRSIERVADRETVCFSVAAEDHLFAAGRDLVVTHNSHLLIKYCLMRIARDPNIRILWVSKTQGLAEKMVGFIRQHLEHNEKLREAVLGSQRSFVPGRTSGLPWTNSQFTIANRTEIRKTPTMVALGTGGQILGLDADLVILDDPQDRKRCLSPANRESDAEWFLTDFLSRKEEDTGVAFIMSRQHIEDLPGHVLRDHADEWDVRVYRSHDPACIVPEREVDKHKDCLLWPEKRSWAWLWGQKRENPAHFERNYQNNPTTDATTYITPDEIAAIRDGTRGVGDIPSGCRLIAGIDPAEAKPVAATLWGYDGIQRHLIDCGEFSASVVGMREILSTWPAKYGVREFAFEKNMAQSWLIDTEVKRLIDTQNLRIHATYTSRVNKQSLAIGPIAMFQRMRTQPPGITLPGKPGLGDDRLNRLIRTFLTFDPDWANSKHSDDDLVLASWFPQLIMDTWERPESRKMTVDYADLGGGL